MLRIAAAVWVVRNDPGGNASLVALRRPGALSQPGYWTFVGEALSAEDEAVAGGEPPSSHPVEGALQHALACTGHRALALHAGIWAHTRTNGVDLHALTAARRRLLVREANFRTALGEADLTLETLEGLVPLGLWRTPPYLARPTDVALFMLRIPHHTPAFIDGPTFEKGDFVDNRALLAAWRAGELPLGPLEVEVLTMDERLSARGQASRAFHFPSAMQAAWTARHPRFADLFEAEATPHQPSMQAPTVEAFPVKSPTLAPATHTNCYVVGNAHVAVIDPGTPYADEQPRLLAWLKGRAAKGSTIDEVWITHHHADHTGAAALVRAHFGARVKAHRHTAEALRDVVAIDETIEDEQLLPLDDVSYRALFTPGHATGHLCFYDEAAKHLFSGDNVLGTGTSIVVPKPHGDMAAYMQALRRILALDARLLFPGHGPPSARAVDRILDTLRQREMRERRLLELLAESPAGLDLTTLLARLYRGIAPAQQKLAALSLRAHVEKLVQEQKAVWQPKQEGKEALLART